MYKGSSNVSYSNKEEVSSRTGLNQLVAELRLRKHPKEYSSPYSLLEELEKARYTEDIEIKIHFDS